MKTKLRLIWQYAKMIRNFVYDLNRYYGSAASEAKTMSDVQLAARLLQKAHSIEKGLAMPNVRPGFGVKPLKELRMLIQEYERRKISTQRIEYKNARHAIGAYIEFHSRLGSQIPVELSYVHEIADVPHNPQTGGCIPVEASAIKSAAKGDFSSLLSARRSTRVFSPGLPDEGAIREAIEMAGRSPSVCNRQGGRARWITNPKLLSEVLELQGGNRGFGNQVPSVILITCYQGLFRGARERNQCWIDGGLFAMTLMYALVFKGFGTCPLNWSSDHKQDKKLRGLLSLPDDEVVIMLLAVGGIPESYSIATSARIGVEQLMPNVYH